MRNKSSEIMKNYPQKNLKGKKMKLHNSLIFGSVPFLVIASIALVHSIPLANPIGLTDLLPWLGIGQFNVKDATEAVLDNSNDDAALLTTHQLIERAGFGYEDYYALSDDGYMTQLIRIINPLADSSHLKPFPVMIQHGQTSNSRNFVMQSNSQHFPMRWPPGIDTNDQTYDNSSAVDDETKSEDEEFKLLNAFSLNQPFGFGPKSSSSLAWSSNRSLAFMLANNGYDVWLTSTRGADENNMGFMGREAAIDSIRKGKTGKSKNMTLGEDLLLLEKTSRSYWSFTLDDQINFEIPSQIETVLNVTGAERVILTGYSNTCLTTFAMMSTRPDMREHIDAFVAIAPVVYYSKLAGWFKWFMEEFMQMIPKSIDTHIFLSERVASFIRRSSIRSCSNVSVRYTMCKFLFDLMFGPSAQFRTNLELPVFSHMLRATSWKCLAQHLQIVKSRRLAKFDYGSRKNKKYYGTKRPPEYQLNRIEAKHLKIALVSGDKDCWANQATVEEIRARLPHKPSLDLVIRDYNHLDLTSAFDVDIRVNLPILKFLDARMDEVSPEHGDHGRHY